MGIVQLVYVGCAVGLGLVVPRIGVSLDVRRNVVIDLLLPAAIGMISFIGVVFSLLFLVAQFGITTYTPRLNLFRDAPIVWHAFSYFVGVIVFAFTAAFVVEQEEQVTVLVPAVMVALILIGLALFRTLQTHAFKSIQLAPTLQQVAERGGQVIDDVYPRRLTPRPDIEGAPQPELSGLPHEVRWTAPAAVVQFMHVATLVERADRVGAVIVCRVMPGQLVQDDGVLAVVYGSIDEALERHVRKAFKMGHERTFDQDPSFALQVLADIALRALSPAINDPRTSSQALDRIESLLRRLAARDLDIANVKGASGETRVVLNLLAWEDYVGIALDEVTAYADRSPMVQRRLEQLLTQMLPAAHPQRRSALEARLRAIEALIETRPMSHALTNKT